MTGILTIVDHHLPLETILALAQVALSLWLAVLVVQVLRRQQREEAKAPSRAVIKELGIELEALRNAISSIIEEIRNAPPAPASPSEPKEAGRLRSVIGAYEKWAKAVRQLGLTQATVQSIDKHHERLADLLKQIKAYPDVSPTGDILNEMESLILQAVRAAVLSTDRDFDPTMSNPSLQPALTALLDSAGMKLICPGRGTPYQRKSEAFPKKVGMVTTRGLQSKRGDILFDPEFREFR